MDKKIKDYTDSLSEKRIVIEELIVSFLLLIMYYINVN